MLVACLSSRGPSKNIGTVPHYEKILEYVLSAPGPHESIAGFALLCTSIFITAIFISPTSFDYNRFQLWRGLHVSFFFLVRIEESTGRYKWCRLCWFGLLLLLLLLPTIISLTSILLVSYLKSIIGVSVAVVTSRGMIVSTATIASVVSIVVDIPVIIIPCSSSLLMCSSWPRRRHQPCWCIWSRWVYCYYFWC